VSLKEIFSCYVSTTYRGDKEAFERIQQYFKDDGRATENQWKKRNADDTKAVFTAGKSFLFTFDYESSALEVRSIVAYSEADGTITVSVGNSGFPFEPLLSKPRYEKLLEKVNAFIVDEGIAVKRSEETSAT